MTLLSFMNRNLFIDTLACIEPHSHATYIEDAISKCVAWSIDNFVENLFVQHICQENFHTHSCLTTTDPCLLFEGQVLTDVIVYLGDLFLHVSLIFRHMHTFKHSGSILNFYWHAKGWDFGLISACYLPHSAIIKMAAWVARLLLWGS